MDAGLATREPIKNAYRSRRLKRSYARCSTSERTHVTFAGRALLRVPPARGRATSGKRWQIHIEGVVGAGGMGVAYLADA